MKQLLFVCLLSIPALANPAPTDPKLAQLVGNWEGGGTFTLEGKPITYKATYSCQRAAIGPGITCTWLASGKDLHYEENHLYGYDKASDTYHLFSVNDWGEAYDHATKWADANKVVFQYDGAHGDKPVREVYTFTFKSDEIKMHGTFTSAGHVVGDGEFLAKRVK